MQHHKFTPSPPNGVAGLVELALDVRWSWNHAADPIWEELDCELWQATHSAWTVLQSMSQRRIDSLLKTRSFRAQVDALLEERRVAAAAPAWFQSKYGQSPLQGVAYFSMEFMLTQALPIYSGGLGNVAGDQLKAAGDLGVPVIGIGLLYAQGYFRQLLDAAGHQQVARPYNDPGQLPISPLRRDDGEWVRLRLEVAGGLWVRAWKVKVGRLALLLLDSNDPANRPESRCITSELYGGSHETRLQQELILGIGGWRLLDATGHQPEVCHLNEGHAAFVVLERARSYMRDHNVPFDVALAATRAGNLFTTHTAVAAGFDHFEPALIERHLRSYVEGDLGLSFEDFLALGRPPGASPHAPFALAHLALRGCGAVNGVSREHGEVSRELFAPLFARWPLPEVPVGHITNGVHMPSWDSAGADELWTESCGKDRWAKPDTGELSVKIRRIADERLWSLRNSARASLIDFARQRLIEQRVGNDNGAEDIPSTKTVLDPLVLTVGFARRFTEYKRPLLLLHDPERLRRILNHPTHPVQLIIAGKAHPEDEAGQAMIARWTDFVRHADVRRRAVFIADYDMLVTERLVQGVDLWVNTPRRPWEACGTSGMKVLVNGGLNLSELSGWWSEAFSPEVGWALDDRGAPASTADHDGADAEVLYGLLENVVTRQFYERDSQGLPRSWLGKVRSSMAELAPRFSSARAVMQYAERHYVPAALEFRRRSTRNALRARQLASWQKRLETSWSDLRFVAVEVRSQEGHHHFAARIELGRLRCEDVQVELYADATSQGSAEHHLAEQAPSLEPPWQFRVSIPAMRCADDYTFRILPRFAGVSVPLEANHICWQR